MSILPGQRVSYLARSNGQQYPGTVIGPTPSGGLQISLDVDGSVKELTFADLPRVSLLESKVAPSVLPGAHSPLSPAVSGQRVSYLARSNGQQYAGTVIGATPSGGLQISLDVDGSVKELTFADLPRVSLLESKVQPPLLPDAHSPLSPALAGQQVLAAAFHETAYTPGQRICYLSKSDGEQYHGIVVGPSLAGGVQLSTSEGIIEIAPQDLCQITLPEESAETTPCEKGCGRPRFRHYQTCCSKCRGPDGPHSVDCISKCSVPSERVRPIVPPGFCVEGCGRLAAPGFKTCCKSCSYLSEKLGIFGHTALCDIRANNGTETPWYWRGPSNADRSIEFVQRSGEQFHDEVEEEYVKSMGTKLIQQTMPDVAVTKCLRVQDSRLWAVYAAKRAEIRSRHPPELKELKPLTHQSLDYSAVNTLDRQTNEVWLFHGTSDAAAKAIVNTDFRLPSSAGLFGKGLYFADKASKSWGYSKRGSEGYVMMMCRVVLGYLYHHTGGVDQKAERHVVGTEYDSLLGIASSDNREFLVYDSAQVYPEYIMYCEQGQAASLGAPNRKKKGGECVIA